jgi:molybdopterin converting factor small subunit
MTINIIIFGQLAEIAGSTLSLENVTDTNTLVKELHSLYPLLSDSKYVIAVNNKMVNENTILTENSTVALLPPFSGG